MTRFRFTIASLLAIVLFVAVGFASLRESSDHWESGLFTATLGILLISILLTVHRDESDRAFWLGFALFGSVYLGLTLVPSIESRLITNKALAYLDSKVPVRSLGIFTVQYSAGSGSQLKFSNVHHVKLWDAATGRLLGGWGGTRENFIRIGHSLFALLLGWLGGQLSRRLCRASRHAEVPTPVEPGGNTL